MRGEGIEGARISTCLRFLTAVEEMCLVFITLSGNGASLFRGDLSGGSRRGGQCFRVKGGDKFKVGGPQAPQKGRFKDLGPFFQASLPLKGLKQRLEREAGPRRFLYKIQPEG